MSTADEREIRRKLKVLRHAGHSGNTAKICRYFGVSRSTFYRWQRRYKKFGEAGLKNEKDLRVLLICSAEVLNFHVKRGGMKID